MHGLSIRFPAARLLTRKVTNTLPIDLTRGYRADHTGCESNAPQQKDTAYVDLSSRRDMELQDLVDGEGQGEEVDDAVGDRVAQEAEDRIETFGRW